MPLVGWNSHHHRLPTTAEGSRKGAKKHSRHSHLKCVVWWAIRAISRATTTISGTTYSVNWVLCHRESHTSGSRSASR